MTATTAAPQSRKGALVFIFFVVLLDLIGMTILTPVAAYVVREYSAEALTVSMLTVIYAAAQFFAAPLLGKLSDRSGRRPVLLISILGSAAGYYILFGIGGALWVLFLSRLIDGFTGGNISTASAYLADVTPPEKRARNFGLLGMAFGLGGRGDLDRRLCDAGAAEDHVTYRSAHACPTGR
jgi:MFS family permease